MIWALVWRLCSSPALGIEAEPDMVGGPNAMRIAERGPQQLDDLAHHRGPVRLGELIEKGSAEGPEPAFHAGLERGRARHERDLSHREAALGEEAAIFVHSGKEPRRDQRRIALAQRAERAHRGGEGRHIAVAAELAHEAAARPKRAHYGR